MIRERKPARRRRRNDPDDAAAGAGAFKDGKRRDRAAVLYVCRTDCAFFGKVQVLKDEPSSRDRRGLLRRVTS